MNIDIQNAKIDFAATGPAEILRNVRMIITTLAGTVPFDREFGINPNIFDQPLEHTKNLLTVEYIEKVRRYEPRAKIKQVTFEYDTLNGAIYPKVVIEFGD